MRTKMFVIDDGARHTICAHDKAGAYALYVRMLCETDGDWPDEWPTNLEVPSDKEVTIDLQNNLRTLRDGAQHKPTLTAAEWCQLVGESYLACSEY